MVKHIFNLLVEYYLGVEKKQQQQQQQQNQEQQQQQQNQEQQQRKQPTQKLSLNLSLQQPYDHPKLIKHLAGKDLCILDLLQNRGRNDKRILEIGINTKIDMRDFIFLFIMQQV